MSNLILAAMILALGLLIATDSIAAPVKPISLHPNNPKYFLFREKPTVLITSAEHYGAVLNLDFQQKPYLDELKRSGMNYTRIFTGAYCESPGDFQIPHNTLAPAAGKLICPWARSNQPGYVNGGNKYDLSKWDDAYFKRLKSYIKEAGKRGVVVEISLFCPFYGDSMWNLSPMKSANNINGLSEISSQEAYSLKHKDITRIQEEMTKKIVSELRDFDNIFYEICNEPYFGGVTLEWQKHIAAVIKETESKFASHHLVAQNINNGSERVINPDPNISILNFHYANPPLAVEQNSSFKGVIGCDETGFQGQADSPYREEGWEFILAGGALYNNLDYSFTISNPEGTAKVEPPTPGGGGVTFRAGMSALKKFMDTFNFIKMSPDNTIQAPDGITIRALSEPGKQYAIYIRGGSQTTIKLDLPQGKYQVKWTNTHTGETLKTQQMTHKGGTMEIVSPEYDGDTVVSIKRK
jgi:hypothetical protein